MLPGMTSQCCRVEVSRPRRTYQYADRAPHAKARGYLLSPWLAAVGRYATLIGLGLALLAAHAEEIFLRANQIGYQPLDAKIAIAFSTSSLPDSFSVVAADSGATAWHGIARPVTGVNWGQFANHVELDFSALKTPGRYVLQVGEAKSLPFTIGSGSLRANCLASSWNSCASSAAATIPGSTRSAIRSMAARRYGPLTNGTYLDARGGWHDAADLLKYLLTSGNATAQMLLAYQMGSPESKVQSLKSRAAVLSASPGAGCQRTASTRWASRIRTAFPTCWTRRAGGWSGCSSCTRRPTSFITRSPTTATTRARACRRTRLPITAGAKAARAWCISPTASRRACGNTRAHPPAWRISPGRYAAAMALAYQIWKDDPRQRPFAERCLQAGKEVYELGRAKEGVQQGNSYSAPYRYEETTWADDMEWGAAELFRATGERRYLDEAKRYAKLAAVRVLDGQGADRPLPVLPVHERRPLPLV